MNEAHCVHRGRRSSGLTIVETLIVVAILGILAAILAPRFATTSDRARVNGTVKDFRTFETAVNVYAARNNGDMPISNSVLQSEIEKRLATGSTSSTPPIGGYYGFHSWSDSDAAAVAVWSAKHPNLLADIDEILDDGNLLTGRVRSGPNNGIAFFVYGPVPTDLQW